MSTIFNLAGMNPTDYAYARNADTRLLYGAVNTYLGMVQEAMRQSMSLLVSGDTTAYSELYQLPMGGRMAKQRPNVPSAVKKAYGNWSVGYPIDHFSDMVAADYVDFAYLTPAEFQRHIDGILTRYAETVRFEALRRLFNNTAWTVTDDRWGTITVQALANGDSVLYPPVIGSSTEATDNHYLESGYAVGSISDANNPIATIVEELVEHFGRVTGGSDIVVFINKDAQAKIEALTTFVEYKDMRIALNDTAPELSTLPQNVPGQIIGRVSGATISVWDYVPANYMFGVHREAEAPLKRRVDPAETGLGNGALVNMEQVSDTVLTFNRWYSRFGFGVGNRLNGVVMELGTGGSYTIPTIYA